MNGTRATDQNTISTYAIESVTDFLNKIESQHQIITRLVRDEKTVVSTVYRGQLKHEKHPLLPQLLRFDKTSIDGMQSPNTRSNQLPSIASKGREGTLVEEFKRQSAFFLSASTTPHSDLEWLALAQHHGLATRLLDWSESPLTALFFAVEPTSLEDGIENAEAVVWSFTGSRLEGDCLGKRLDDLDDLVEQVGIRIYFPPHISNRFVAQQGCFTVHSLRPSFRPLEEALSAEKDPQYHLAKFIVPSECREKIKEELYRLGTNYVSLFPDLDGLCQKLNWLSAKSPKLGTKM
jgi:FRG domain